ncbi:MAG: haloacid dehalogenase-like hydrolase [Planctomycetota bacterium]
MLVLFDIDGTLLLTANAGLDALVAAGRDLFGPDFFAAGVVTSGGVDPGILRELLLANGQSPDLENVARLRRRYRDRLELALGDGRPLTVLPGVGSLLEALSAREDVTLGLLTGNFRETGEMKLARCGLDPRRFAVGAYGCDCDFATPMRRQLPPVALARFAALERPARGRAVVIGDTPHDIDCARAHGLRSLGVATGTASREALDHAGADLAVRDLAQTERVLDFLLAAS